MMVNAVSDSTSQQQSEDDQYQALLGTMRSRFAGATAALAALFTTDATGLFGHGQGPCADEKESLCSGFICECSSDESDADGHGDTYGMPCKEAHCYHCGWQGVFPKPPSKAAPWEKKALEAGWTPTPQRAVELGLTLSQ